jgi:hypothetical protein
MFIRKIVLYSQTVQVQEIINFLESLNLPKNELSWRIKPISGDYSSVSIFSPELNGGLFSSVLLKIVKNNFFSIPGDF